MGILFSSLSGEKKPQTQSTPTQTPVTTPPTTPSQTQSVTPLSCEELYTKYNDYGGGNPVYLDRHNITCPQDKPSLMKFKYELNNDNKNEFRYKYTCCSTQKKDTLSTIERQTPSNLSQNDIFFLDRHPVNCSDNTTQKILSSFVLTRPDPKNMSYKYTCTNTNVGVDGCQDMESSPTVEMTGSSLTKYLADLEVSCPENMAVSDFKLVRGPKNNQAKYVYKCCPIKN